MFDVLTGNWVLVTNTEGGYTRTMLDNILCGIMYRFRVRAFNEIGSSVPGIPSDAHQDRKPMKPPLRLKSSYNKRPLLSSYYKSLNSYNKSYKSVNSEIKSLHREMGQKSAGGQCDVGERFCAGHAP